MSYLFSDKVAITGEAVRMINENQSQFGETVTVSRTPVIELNSSYGTSKLRNIENLTGSGTITPNMGKITLSTGTTANSSSRLDSAEVGRYVPGFSAQLGVGISVSSLPTGNHTAIWGGLGPDSENGFYFGIDSTGLFSARRSNNVESDKIYQTNFNIDPLDGSGPSGYNLNVMDGVIYQIDFTWYGYGQILFGIVGILPDNPNTNGRNYIQQFIPCHSLKVNGDVSTYSPNFRVFAQVENNADASDFSVDVGGRQYSIVGKYVSRYRFVGDFRSGVTTTTTPVPLISFQRKSGFGDRSIKLEGFDTIAATEPCIVEVRLDATLTGSTFGTPTNHTASETAVESDTSATESSGGIVVWQQLIDAGTNKNSGALASSSVDFDIPDKSSITLTARTLSGTGTISAAFRLREEW